MPLDTQEIKALFLRLAPHDGITKTQMNTVKLMRASHPIGRTPVLYDPSIVIVCSGQKKGFLGNKIYLYDAAHYLVLTVPLPFFTETNASVEDPLLAISIDLDLSVISELVSVLDTNEMRRNEMPKGMISTSLDERLSNATHRLLTTLTSTTEISILAPAIIKEIYYHILIGEQGSAVRNALISSGQFGKIAKALKYIQHNYKQSITVHDLADYCGLSIPAFHAHFKQVTHSSPIQYIKSIRLQQARLMMIRDNTTAAYAAARVGYESATQFNREFKRLFGQSPGAEAKVMKAAFSLQEAPSLNAF